MMNNYGAILQQFTMMMQQGGANPQAYVNELLRRNPEFARQIQGKNVQQMAGIALRGMGIDPQQFFNNPAQFVGMMRR